MKNNNKITRRDTIVTHAKKIVYIKLEEKKKYI